MDTEIGEHVIAGEQVQNVASIVAQQKAMERGVRFMPHGTRLFTALSGWESMMIARDPHAVSCDTLMSLEAALKDKEAKVIFIPQTARFTDADIEKVCQRNGITKTLFREVEEV
jgi:hypothetical protein